MPRFNLPEIQFVNKSVEKVEQEVVARYEAETGKKLSKADPRRIFLQTIVALLAQQRSLIDYSAKQNLLSYASGPILDHIGVRSDSPRLGAVAAKTIQRFNLSTAQPQTIISGTRVTAGDGVIFSTLHDVLIQNGQVSVDVEVECTQTGVIGNGYAIGEINQLVDPIQWVQSVENVTVSSGGADEEDDDSYAERIRKAPERYSVAGPTGAYEYWAKTAHPSIIDVSVRSPSDGVVEIRPLLEDGDIPTQTILDAVMDICNDRNIRPLTDKVQVVAPEQVSYDITISYWIRTSDASTGALIQAAVNKAIEEYKTWQKGKLGRDVDPSELIARVKSAGAKRVSVTLPAFLIVESHQVAKENEVNIIFGGLEDD